MTLSVSERATLAESAPVSWSRVAALSFAGALGLLMLYGWLGVAPAILAPALLGACVGVSVRGRIEAAFVGGMVATFGLSAARLLYSTELQAQAEATIPAWAVKDLTQTLQTRLVGPILQTNPVAAAETAGRSFFATFALGAILVVAVAFIVAWVCTTDRRRMVGGWLVTIALGMALFATLTSSTAALRAELQVEPSTTGGSTSDHGMNLQTLHLMQRGTGFYDAYALAHGMDARQLYPVEGTKFLGVSAAMLRQPAMFYMWTVAGRVGGIEAGVWLAIVGVAAVSVLSYWALLPAVGIRAVFIAPFLFPALVLQAGDTNILLPEFWATLALLSSFFLLVRGRLLAAGVAGLLAVIFRETYGVWLLSLAVASLFSDEALRVRLRAALGFLGLLGAAVLAFLLHMQRGSRNIVSGKSGGLGGYLGAVVSSGIERKLFGPLAYLMYPYGMFFVHPVAIALVGIVGNWVGLASVRIARTATLIYSLLWVGYLTVFGAPSQYWGEALVPILLVGFGLFAVKLDDIAEPEVWMPESFRLKTPSVVAEG